MRRAWDAQTVYPAGFSLDEALQIYWRAQNYQLVAAGNGVLGPVTQALSVNGLLPPRNAGVGTNNYYEIDGLTPVGPGDLVIGVGMRTVVPGTGTITASGPGISGTNSSALFNFQVNLFYPEIFAPDPVIQYDGKWWPAMSVSCSVTNTVALASGGSLAIEYRLHDVRSGQHDGDRLVFVFRSFGAGFLRRVGSSQRSVSG